MTTRAAIKGSYAHFQLVPTRKVVKIVIEAPIEQAQQVIDALGFPGATEEQWLAVAKLDPTRAQDPSDLETRVKRWEDDKISTEQPPKPEKPKSSNRIAAVMLCKYPLFWQFLTKTDWVTSSEEGAADYVRKRCGVASRTELDGNKEAATKFWKIHGQFEAWRSGEVA